MAKVFSCKFDCVEYWNGSDGRYWQVQQIGQSPVVYMPNSMNYNNITFNNTTPVTHGNICDKAIHQILVYKKREWRIGNFSIHVVTLHITKLNWKQKYEVHFFIQFNTCTEAAFQNVSSSLKYWCVVSFHA